MTVAIFDPEAREEFLSAIQYAIIYSIEPEHIRVLAIAHTKRKPGYWLGRSEDAP
jgi:hypothetical protein